MVEAKLSFRKGDTIYSDEPYSTAVDHDRLGDTCSWCFRRGFPGPIECSSCSRVIYCSDKCRDKDSTYHCFECLFLKTGADDTDPAKRFALRTLARVLEDRRSNTPSVGYFFEHRRTYEDLVSHAREMEESRTGKFRLVGEELAHLLCEHGYDVSRDLIVEIMQKLVINGHGAEEFVDNEYLLLGHVLYLGASRVDHTCQLQPDYIQVFIGNRTIFRALEDFTLENPLQLRCHYLPLHFSYTIRHELLKRTYYFVCQCTKCIHDMFEPTYAHFDALESMLNLMVTPENESQFLAIEVHLRRAPNTNFYKHRLMCKLFLECSQKTVDRAYHLGTSALEGCQHHHDRLKIMYILCQKLNRFGANDPAHKYHSEFEKLQGETLRIHALAYGENHPLVKSIADLLPLESSIQSTTRTTIPKDTKLILET